MEPLTPRKNGLESSDISNRSYLVGHKTFPKGQLSPIILLQILSNNDKIKSGKIK